MALNKKKQAITDALDTARKYRDAGGATNQTPWYQRDEARNLSRGLFKSPAASLGKVGQITPPIIKGGNLAASTPVGQALGSSTKVASVKPQFPKLPTAPKPPKMKRGGEVEGKLLSEGPLLGSTPGRADKVNAKVEDGSYIIPADCVSACGQNSSLAGHAAIEHMLSKLPKVKSANKTKSRSNSPVPVALSDGEHIIGKDSVERIGGGDYEKGKKILDHFVMHIRRRQIHELSKLPPPAQGDE